MDYPYEIESENWYKAVAEGRESPASDRPRPANESIGALIMQPLSSYLSDPRVYSDHE